MCAFLYADLPIIHLTFWGQWTDKGKKTVFDHCKKPAWFLSNHSNSEVSINTHKLVSAVFLYMNNVIAERAGRGVISVEFCFITRYQTGGLA